MLLVLVIKGKEMRHNNKIKFKQTRCKHSIRGNVFKK